MRHNESYEAIGEVQEKVEILEEDVFVALSQGTLSLDQREDLLSRIEIMTKQLEQHEEPLLSEECVATLKQLEKDVRECPVNKPRNEEEEERERLRAGESQD
jgi:hypothetical protein